MVPPPVLHINGFFNRKNSSAEDIKKKKEIPEGFLCRENFHQYMDETTLHGLKYIGDRSLSVIER